MERIVAFTVITRSDLFVESSKSHPASRSRTVPTAGFGIDFWKIYGGSPFEAQQARHAEAAATALTSKAQSVDPALWPDVSMGGASADPVPAHEVLRRGHAVGERDCETR
jgi:hypothetical protein